jgi:hypothetical protein
MPGAADIDDGEFYAESYAEMKAPKRERDLSTGQLRYRWSETGALDHFRHAHAFDHLASPAAIPEVIYVWGGREVG